MTTRLYAASKLVLAAFVALTAASKPCAAGDFLYAQTTATQSYPTFIGPVPIIGLTLSLPPANKEFNTAVVTLNMPNLFLTQNAGQKIVMSATLQIVAPFSAVGPTVASGGIGCDNSNVVASGKKPLTIVTKIPLTDVAQLVEAEWSSNATVTTEKFASLSAVMVKE